MSESTRIIPLMAKVILPKLGHGVLSGFVKNVCAFCEQFELNTVYNTL